MPAPDARTTNWRFVAPEGDAEVQLLDDEAAHQHRTVLEALGSRPCPAVVVPDLAVWAGRAGVINVLGSAATRVAPGGWLCVGFPNRLFPGSSRRRGAMTLRAARATLDSEGLHAERVYLPLPDHRRAALLVDAASPAQLDYVFRRLFLTYVPGGSTRVRLLRRLLVLARRLALITPQPLRVALAPGYLVIARRPGD
jgi:hypothetical protein